MSWLSAWFRPAQWLGGASPRRIALATGVGLAVAAAFAVLISFSRAPGLLQGGAPAAQAELEKWRYVTVDSLNVREAPKAGAQIVGVLYRNQRVMIAETERGWTRLVQPQWGFVASKYLQDSPVP